MAKVTTVSATPDSWAGELRRREILYDPVHAEMIGAEYSIPTPRHEEMAPTDDVGALMDVELVGAEVPIYATEPAFREYQLVGDDTDDADLMADSVTDAPEEADSKDAPTDVVQMQDDDDSNAPGVSAPPAFSAPSGPLGTIPPPRGVRTRSKFGHPTQAAAAVKQSIAHFRAKIHARDPHAVKALFHLQAKAQHSPIHAATLNAVKNANLGLHTAISGSVGQVLMSGSAHVAMTRILSLALSPVAWATHGVGTVAKGVGAQLEGLARKL